jgi:hypothetical protein
MTEMLSIEVIRMDGGTQPRATLNEELIEDYRVAMKQGAEFPPVTVFYDGENHWLADGFHRVQARKSYGNIAADIRQGTKRDAILYSLSANATHGMRRSAEDKRRSVERMLRDHEWRKLADREIARHCAVSPQTVGTYRKRLESEAEAAKAAKAASVQSGQIEPETRKVTRGGKTYTMNTAKIGGLDAPVLGKSRPFKKPKPVPVVVQDADLEHIVPMLHWLRNVASTAGKISPEAWHRRLPVNLRHNLDYNLRPAADFINALVKVHEEQALAAGGEP